MKACPWLVMRKPPASERWVRVGPRNPSWLVHMPKAEMCISAFVVARRGNALLLGRPRGHDAWPEMGGYPKWAVVQLEKEGAWLLPATHLLMEEHPEHAARRIAHKWAGLEGNPRFIMVQSHLRRFRIWKKKARGNHWDLCFVYEMRVRHLPKLKRWWAEMRFVPFSEVPKMRIGRGHLDVLKEAGYFRPASLKTN